MLSVNLDGLENDVKPLLQKTMTYLKNAQDILYFMAVPSDFSYNSTLRSMPETVGDIYKVVKNNEKWLSEAISNFSNAENSNSSLLDNIMSLFLELTQGNNIEGGLKETSNPVDDLLNFLSSTGDMAIDFFGSLGEFLMDSGEAAMVTASNMGEAFLSLLSDSWNTATGFAEDVSNFFKNDLPVMINDVGTAVFDFLDGLCEVPFVGPVFGFFESTSASIINLFGGVFKGLAGLGESLLDTLVLIGSGVGTAYTGAWDGLTYLGSLITGNTDSWESLTVGMWSNTMSFVAEDHVSNAYKDFYENNIFGQWLDKHAHDWFKSDGAVTGLASGITYVLGIVALSYFTFGIAGLAAGGSTAISAGGLTAISSLIAGLAGAGEGTEYIWGQKRDSSMEGIERMLKNGEISQEQYDSIIMIRQMTDEQWEEIELDYKNGNISKEQYDLMREIREIPEDWKNFDNLISGLGYGAAVGTWEGIQWYLGGKLTGWSIPGKQGLTSATRIGIDSLFNAGDTPFRALIESLATGEDLNKTFENQGGMQSLLMNFGIGFLGSFGGELYDTHKINQNNINMTNRLNGLTALEGLDNLTTNRIREILESQSNNKKIDINNMTDVQLNQYVLELLRNRNSQIDNVIEHLYGSQGGNISDQVRIKIENGVDAINRTGLLDNMDETKANNIRNYIMESYFSNNINLNDINRNYIMNLSNAYEDEFIRQIIFEKDYNKASEYLFENTDAAYNKKAFKETEELIFKNIKQLLGDKEAAITTGRILENLIERRGGYIEIANVDGIKINIIKDLDWKNAATKLEDITRMINNLPQELKDTIKEINISDLYNPSDKYWEFEYKNKGHISGMTGGNGEINIYIMGNFSGILHESGHCFDSVHNISSSKEWIASMEADSKINGNKMGITDYADRAFNASGTRGEDFAESVNLYIINPESFKKKYPNRWKILNELFN